MSYEQVIEKLKAAHLYPDKSIEIGKDHKEKTTGIHVYANSFTYESRKELIIKTIGDKFKVDWAGSNHNYISITKR